MSGLIVCATQRSGSTLLCELLKATGVTGIPNEYFQHFKDTGLVDQPRQYCHRNQLSGRSDGEAPMGHIGFRVISAEWRNGSSVTRV
jgi:LPS sulfotransferase NodH